MKPFEACEKRPLLARIAVDKPSQLSQPDWRDHLLDCADCRAEAGAHARALSVFTHVETARVSGGAPEGPSWEQLASALDRGQGLRRWLRPPAVAAAASVTLLFGVALAWQFVEGDDLPSAHVVTLKPTQRVQVNTLIRRSLTEGASQQDVAPAAGAVDAASEPPQNAAPGFSAAPGGTVAEASHSSAPADTRLQPSPFLLPRVPIVTSPVRFASPGMR